MYFSWRTIIVSDIASAMASEKPRRFDLTIPISPSLNTRRYVSEGVKTSEIVRIDVIKTTVT